MELQVPHILLMFRREFYESLWGQQLALGKLVLALVTFIPLCSAVQETKAEEDTGMEKERIRIYPANPRYWQYKGEPILLIGGSVEDNLFQIPNLKEHLELLKSVGGNYVRSTMSWVDEGDVPPFKKVGDRFDLNQWNNEFWRRFRAFITLPHELDIIVQIEVWATFNYYREPWDANPFNPKNNSNYTAEETGLSTVVKSHPVATENNFFWSVPKERNQQIVLKYQQKFVGKLLSETLQYGHVLYCMDNETAVTPEWGEYWATYIQKQAAAPAAPLRLRRCRIRGIYSTRSIEQHSTILKSTRFVIYHRITIRKGRCIGITPRDIGKNSRRSVLSIILRFTALMEDDSAVHRMGWSGFGEIFSADWHQPGFTVLTAGSV